MTATVAREHARTNEPDAFVSAESTRKLQLKIGGLHCSFCAGTIEQAMDGTPGVRAVSVNLAHEEALIEYEPVVVGAEKLKAILLELGYTLRDASRPRTVAEDEAELRAQLGELRFAAAAAALSVALMVLGLLGWLPRAAAPFVAWAMPTLALTVIFGPGWHILTMAIASLRRRILNQHVLLEFGAFAGLLGGFLGFAFPVFPLMDFFAVAVFITTYHLLSGYVSLRVRTRASQAVRRLLGLTPPSAQVVREGHETELPLDEVRVGDLVRIRPGGAVPVDGVVVEGRSNVDEHLVTGESLPVGKAERDEVIGGSLNQTGALLVRVSRVGEETFLAQVAHHVEEARALKPGILVVVDRVLKVYVPAVLTAAALGVLIWTVGAWAVTGRADVTRAVFAALAALVMGYPCALGMATPLALIRGGGMAAERGILMRSAEAFQVLKDVDTVVLDKTGTITRGQPDVVEVVALSGSERDVMRLAAAVEAHSEHPLARAIVDHARELGIAVPPAADFAATPGGGVEANVDGAQVLVGSPRFLASRQVSREAVADRVTEQEHRGRTVVGAAAAGALIGFIAIADSLKDDARAAIAALRAAGLEPIMLTGDNARTAAAIARAVGITEFRAEVLPQDKAAEVRRLQKTGRRVAMVGDGINDAPALMQADVGIAIGAGTDIAIEAADVVLVGERLGALLDAFHIGRSSYRKTVQNLTIAFAFNGVGVPLAVTGLVHPVWAMAAMVASVSTVLANSFGGRLLPSAKGKVKR